MGVTEETRLLKGEQSMPMSGPAGSGVGRLMIGPDTGVAAATAVSQHSRWAVHCAGEMGAVPVGGEILEVVVGGVGVTVIVVAAAARTASATSAVKDVVTSMPCCP